MDYITIFAVLISGFIISKYFENKRNEIFIYPKKDYFLVSYIISLIVWLNFILNLENKIMYFLYLGIMSVLLFKEIICSIIKLTYFDNKYKVILKTGDQDKKQLKNAIVAESLKNIFYLLGAPIIFLETLIRTIFNKIFKGE